jgi:hypothetical protein
MFGWASVSPPFPPRGEGGRGACGVYPGTRSGPDAGAFEVGQKPPLPCFIRAARTQGVAILLPEVGCEPASIRILEIPLPASCMVSLEGGRGRAKKQGVGDRAYPGTEMGS